MLVDYVWIDGDFQIRSMTVVSKKELRQITIDGSSTNQSQSGSIDIILDPVREYVHPLRPDSKIAICECKTLNADRSITSHPKDTRSNTRKILECVSNLKLKLSFNQEYYLPQTKDGFNDGKLGSTYCSVANNYMHIMDVHLKACVDAGVGVYSCHQLDGPSQMCYKTARTEALQACDDLWISRYILQLICNKYSIRPNFMPKPYAGIQSTVDPTLSIDTIVEEKIPGSGCHVEFSTIFMRSPGGSTMIKKIIEKMSAHHSDFIQICGAFTNMRLIGECKTSSLGVFTSTVAAKNSSIRIPKSTSVNQYGYIEDRRPSSNVNPYVYCRALCDILKS